MVLFYYDLFSPCFYMESPFYQSLFSYSVLGPRHLTAPPSNINGRSASLEQCTMVSIQGTMSLFLRRGLGHEVPWLGALFSLEVEAGLKKDRQR